ncbi:S-layer homology domain-containing protein [Paenibacillus sp. D2_2]|uniref:S-layer homology domain-containing protein n=1 Tax=Paenibacillus sp. D2_2 TaxID=3073092 RepID=UPI002816450B|nr:S-layer homology domain-containing protein [Paenibacillus sp. D2_2]WMT41906.1 S-layer homology domain-containing protein [Paenibacillus sp. D2_2]
MLHETGIKGKNIRFIIGEAKADGVDKKVIEQIGSRPVIELLAEVDGKAIRWVNELTPVTVMIPYLPTVTEETARIGVLDLSEQGKAKAVPQAAYVKADQFVQFQTGHTGIYAVIYTGTGSNSRFEDLGKYPWAQQAVKELAAKGIVKGTSATTFSPANQVTRADFILMLVRALDLQADVKDNFADVKTNDYYYEAVGIAKKLGIVTGIGGDRFEPKAKITRQDMMVMVARALEVSGKKEIQGTKQDLAGYQDAGKVADYAVSSVAGLISQGLIQGSGNMIHPHSHATRAETAVLIYRIYNL